MKATQRERKGKRWRGNGEKEVRGGVNVKTKPLNMMMRQKVDKPDGDSKEDSQKVTQQDAL
jgi:hypothetical protein